MWVTDIKDTSGYAQNIGLQNQMGCSRKILLQALKKETSKGQKKWSDI